MISDNYRAYQRLTLFLLLSACLMLASGCTRKANDKIFRVGILCGLDFFNDTVDGFKSKLTELGYIEGTNIIYDRQSTNFDPKKEKEILARFVRDKVDLIFTLPTEVSLEAKSAAAGTGIPVLFANANIEGVNLVESVRMPGDGITGVRYPGPDLAIRRLEILREILPNAKNICIPYLAGYPIIQSQLDAMLPIAKSFEITLVELPAANARELAKIIKKKLGDKKIDAVLQIADPLCVDPEAFRVFASYAIGRKAPVGGAIMSVDGHESIFGVSTNNASVGKQAAGLANKILQGVEAGSLPVVSAESHLTINYKAAQKQNLKVPEGLLSRADEIIR